MDSSSSTSMMVASPVMITKFSPPIPCAITAAPWLTQPRSRRGRTRAVVVSWPLYRVLAGAALPAPPLIALLTLRQPAIPQHPPSAARGRRQGRSHIGSRIRGRRARDQPARAASRAAGELAGADWVARKLRVSTRARAGGVRGPCPGQSAPVAMTNVIAYRPGRSRQIMAVIAHRDGSTGGDPAGTGILVELARTLADMPPDRGLVLVSTDGGDHRGPGRGRLRLDVGAAVADRRRGRARRRGSSERDAAQDRRASRHSQGTSPTLYAVVRDGLQTFYGAPAGTPGSTTSSPATPSRTRTRSRAR